MPAEAASRFTFEPVRHEHLALIDGWLRQPHWQQWWADPESELGYIRDMLEGRDTTRPFIFCLGGGPVGYIQYWFIGDHQNEVWIPDHPWLAKLPSDAVGVDLSIGDEGLLSKGIGSAVLREFSERLLDEGYRTIVIDPDSENLRAVRAYEKAGFRPVPSLAAQGGDVLIMQYHSKENEQKR